MRAAVLLAVCSVQCVAAVSAVSVGPHWFYRDGTRRAGGAGGSRRVFGGAAARLARLPGACALLGRYWRVRCSCAVLARAWALSAAHCVCGRVSYVAHHTRRPAAPGAPVAAVLYLYRHPGYEVHQEDEGRGLDVTRLQHDVGLVRTRHPMTDTPDVPHALRDLGAYGLQDLLGEEVEVLGFGRTEEWSGEELYSVRLRLVACERDGWRHCVCGVTPARGDPRGVCAGDSGGPVLYQGRQVAVTSMGPVECSVSGGGGGGGATSVVTWLQPYAAVINATVTDADRALRMRIVGAAPPPPPRALAAAGLAILLARSHHT